MNPPNTTTAPPVTGLPDVGLPHAELPGVHSAAGLLGRETAPWLAAHPEKRRHYGLDLYFRDAWDEFGTVLGGDTARMRDRLNTHALLLLKPDAVVRRRLGAAFRWLAGQGMEVAAAVPVGVSSHQARAVWCYQWNIATLDRIRITELMMRRSRSLLVLVRLPADAVPASVRLAHLKGPALAADRLPHHLRSDLAAVNAVINSVHSADEPADVLRESAILVDDRAARQELWTAMAESTVTDPGPVVARLYAESEEVTDLDLATRAARWRTALATAAPGWGPALLDEVLDRTRPWHDLPDAAARAGIPWDDWDTVVVGTNRAPSHLTEGVRILPWVSLADWTAPAPASPAEDRLPG